MCDSLLAVARDVDDGAGRVQQFECNIPVNRIVFYYQYAPALKRHEIGRGGLVVPVPGAYRCWLTSGLGLQNCVHQGGRGDRFFQYTDYSGRL